MPPRHGATPLRSARRRSSTSGTCRRTCCASPRELSRDAASVLGDRDGARPIDDAAFRRAVLAGYPDRVARRRAPHGDRFLLASGTGARLARESGVHDAEFVVAVDVTGGGGQSAGSARSGSRPALDRDWLARPRTQRSARARCGKWGGPRRSSVQQYDQLTVRARRSRRIRPSPPILVASELPAGAARPTPRHQLLRASRSPVWTCPSRISCASRPRTPGAWRRRSRSASRRHDLRRALVERAPETLRVPSGRDMRSTIATTARVGRGQAAGAVRSGRDPALGRVACR